MDPQWSNLTFVITQYNKMSNIKKETNKRQKYEQNKSL